jgi:hypothetical protein
MALSIDEVTVKANRRPFQYGLLCHSSVSYDSKRRSITVALKCSPEQTFPPDEAAVENSRVERITVELEDWTKRMMAAPPARRKGGTIIRLGVEARQRIAW